MSPEPCLNRTLETELLRPNELQPRRISSICRNSWQSNEIFIYASHYFVFFSFSKHSKRMLNEKHFRSLVVTIERFDLLNSELVRKTNDWNKSLELKYSHRRMSQLPLWRHWFYYYVQKTKIWIRMCEM